MEAFSVIFLLLVLIMWAGIGLAYLLIHTFGGELHIRSEGWVVTLWRRWKKWRMER